MTQITNQILRAFLEQYGTIFENSNIELRTWFAAIFLATNHKKGISSVQLASDLGITQKTAWFVLQPTFECMSSSRTQSLIRSRNLNINNCNSLKRLTAIAYTLC